MVSDLHITMDFAGLDGEFGEEEDGKKRRRAWELWSLEDKNIFFESINECGKDFEAIQVSTSRSASNVVCCN